MAYQNDDILIFDHHTSIDATRMSEWRERWPNINPREVACSHCGRVVVSVSSLDAWQRARTKFGEPVYVACWYRCPEHPIEAAKIAAGKQAGAHSRGTAHDSYPQRYTARSMRRWLRCVQEEFHGIGMGMKGSSMHFHGDNDQLLGERAWGY